MVKRDNKQNSATFNHYKPHLAEWELKGIDDNLSSKPLRRLKVHHTQH
jgi:hypothetical protein